MMVIVFIAIPFFLLVLDNETNLLNAEGIRLQFAYISFSLILLDPCEAKDLRSSFLASETNIFCLSIGSSHYCASIALCVLDDVPYVDE